MLLLVKVTGIRNYEFHNGRKQPARRLPAEVIMQKLRFNLVAVVDGVQVTRSQSPSELTVDLMGTSVNQIVGASRTDTFCLVSDTSPKPSRSSYLLACVLATLSQQHGC